MLDSLRLLTLGLIIWDITVSSLLQFNLMNLIILLFVRALAIYT